MCYYTEQSEPLLKVQKRFNAKVDQPALFLQSDYIVGFEFLNVPVILDTSPTVIATTHHWGLVPSWSKDIDFRKHTLNARIETLDEKPSFKNVTSHRCLVIASGFYEWHWNDAKGTSKDKYRIHSAEDRLFAMAGIYDTWKNPQTRESYHSFAIVTTAANEQMEFIHNHKKRMPVLLKKTDEAAWLDANNAFQDFAFPYSVELVTHKLTG